MGSSKSVPVTPVVETTQKVPLGCSKEMDAYLKCVSQHPKGMSGIMEDCEGIMKAYDRCKNANDKKSSSSA